MVKDLKLILNQQSLIPGSEVSGALSFQVTEAKSYKYAKVRLIGRAHVYWLETSGSGRYQSTTSRSATREYLNSQVVVWSKQQSRNRILHPGPYSFPFQFTIPNQRLPPTFRGTDGLIWYGVEGRIGTGALKFDHVVRAELPSVEVVDINFPRFQAPARQEGTKTICCLCCASGPVTLTAEIPRTGFCLGEFIPLNVNLENGSNRRIQLSATLHQRVVYYAEGGHRSYGGGRVVRLLSERLQPRTPTLWSPGNKLIIPLTTETTMTSCDIILVGYVLKVSAQISGANSLSVEIPILIGNVPRRDPNQASVTDSLPPISVPPVAGPAPYSSQQAPTAYGPQGSTPYDPPGGDPDLSAQEGPTPSDPYSFTSTFDSQGQPPSPVVEWAESSTGPGQGQPIPLSDTSTKPASELAPPPYSAIEEKTTL